MKKLIFVQARALKVLAFLFLFANLTACATYQGKVRKAREMLKSDPDKAAKTLEKHAKVDGKDQLVYLFDYGTALQLAGDYRKSTEVLLQADQMSEVKDYASISKQTASIFLNQEMVQYKGDDYEKVLINAMLAINFLMQDNLNGALVETRRLIEKLEHYRVDAKKNYEQNVFAVYLGAMIWENNRDWDDAYIAFEKAYKLNPTIEHLQEDLVRAAYRAQRPETARKWQKEFGVKPKKSWRDQSQGELVLIYQQGWGPRKYPNPQFRRVPKLYPVNSYTQGARMEVVGVKKVDSQKVYSVEEVAIKTLDDEYASLIAKRIAAIAAKKVAADQIRQKNETLGIVADIFMQAADRADLRQWSTLPETFQVAKLRLKAGTYKVRVSGLNGDGMPTGEAMEEQTFTVKPGKKTFFTWRSFE